MLVHLRSNMNKLVADDIHNNDNIYILSESLTDKKQYHTQNPINDELDT